MSKKIIKRRILFFSVLAAAYISLLFTFCFPASKLQSHVIGSICNDLYDEMLFELCAAEQIFSGKFPLYNDLLSYPVKIPLIESCKSYLHLFFTAPLIYLFDWPVWWNLVALSAITITSFTIAICIYLLSGNRLLAFLSGVIFLNNPWLHEESAAGHIAQLSFAPCAAAMACLYIGLTGKSDNLKLEAFLKKNNLTKYFIILGILFTIIASLVFWIWGGIAALFGFCLLISEKRNKLLITKAIYSAFATILILLPAAVWTISTDYEMLNMSQKTLPEQEIHNAELKASGLSRRDLIIRKFLMRITGAYSSEALPEHSIKSTSRYQAITILFAIFIISALLANRRGSAALWCLFGLYSYSLCLGPFLDSYTNNPQIMMPFGYFAELSGIGLRWRLPTDAWPAFLFSLCAASAVFRQKALKNDSKTLTAISIIMIASAFYFAINDNSISDINGNNSFTKCIPSFPAKIPPYTKALKMLPKGAVIDLPLGYTGNVWHNVPLHTHPSATGKAPVSNIIRINDAALMLMRMAGICVIDNSQQFYPWPDAIAAEVPYGTQNNPAIFKYYNLLDKENQMLSRLITKDSLTASWSFFENNNIKYAILHKANSHWSTGNDLFYKQYAKMLEGLLGKPLYLGEDAIIFSINKNDIIQRPSYNELLRKTSLPYYKKQSVYPKLRIK